MHAYGVHREQGPDDTVHGGIRLQVWKQAVVAYWEHLREDDIPWAYVLCTPVKVVAMATLRMALNSLRAPVRRPRTLL